MPLLSKSLKIYLFKKFFIKKKLNHDKLNKDIELILTCYKLNKFKIQKFISKNFLKKVFFKKDFLTKIDSLTKLLKPIENVDRIMSPTNLKQLNFAGLSPIEVNLLHNTIKILFKETLFKSILFREK